MLNFKRRIVKPKTRQLGVFPRTEHLISTLHPELYQGLLKVRNSRSIGLNPCRRRYQVSLGAVCSVVSDSLRPHGL